MGAYTRQQIVRSSSLHMIVTDGVPKSDREVLVSLVNKRGLQQALPALAATLFFSRTAKAAATAYLKPGSETAEFTAEQAKVSKYALEATKIRAAWDGLLSKFDASETPDALESTLKDMRRMLANMPAQIPSGAKKADLVKTARAKKLINPKGKSKKTKEWWTTKVEIEYQALIQQWNKNVNPDNRVEEKVF